MAKLIKRILKIKKSKLPLFMGWAEDKERKKFEATVETWRSTPPEMMFR